MLLAALPLFVVGAMGLAIPSAPNNTQPRSPAEAAAQLLAADSTFSARSAQSNLIDGLTAMFAPNIAIPNATWARGMDQVRSFLASNPENATSRAEWTPIRAGVSGDGQHGFTYGYMVVTRASGLRVHVKYVAYWMRGEDGWRVVAYKRAVRPDKPASTRRREAALPEKLIAFAGDVAVQRAADEIAAAERNFSAAAQSGLGAAFRSNAADDAAHMGGPDDAEFRFGPNEIASGADDGQPSTTTVTWAPDVVLAASSGDLGISMGSIVVRTPAANGNPERVQQRPFFTVWRKTAPNAAWRFVVE